MSTFQSFKLKQALSIGIAIAAIWLGAKSWAPDRSIDQLVKRWAPHPSQFIEVDGMQVHIRDEGPRSDLHPIVLIHGTGASLHTWDGWAEALVGSHRVVRMDLPGFGLTGPNPSGNYSTLAYAEFVDHVMEKLGIEDAVIAGNSLGGEIAWLTAVYHPHRVQRLILICAAGYAFESRKMPIAFKLAQLPWLESLVTRFLPRKTIEDSVSVCYGRPELITSELIDRYYELALRSGNRAALIKRFSQTIRGNHAEDIKRVSQPVLILWGSKDNLIPVSNAHRFAEDLPRSQVVIFDELGHVPHEENPQKTLQAAISFMSQ